MSGNGSGLQDSRIVDRFASPSPLDGTCLAAIAFYLSQSQSVETHVEKVVLLCLMIAIIIAFAEFSPTRPPQRPEPQQ